MTRNLYPPSFSAEIRSFPQFFNLRMKMKICGKNENQFVSFVAKNKKSDFQNGNFIGNCKIMEINYLTISEFLNWQMAEVFGSFGNGQF